MRTVARTAAVGALLVLSGCAGTSAFERCVQHSVEEDVARDVAEQGCRDAGIGEQA